MSHMIDETTGRAATCWRGEAPWHGLGHQMNAGEDLESWLVNSGMDWKALRFRLGMDRANEITGAEDQNFDRPVEFGAIDEMNALCRSDTGGFLGMVSPNYKIVQPRDVMYFFEDLTKSYGFEMETAGVLREGRIVWALASTGLSTKLEDVDEVKAYLLLSTSFDRSLATTARFTSIRVVCNNTLTLASTEDTKSMVTISHAKKFDPDQAKIDLKIGNAWEQFKVMSDKLIQTRVTEEDQARFLLKLYHGIDEPQGTKTEIKTITRLAQILRTAPGADMPTAVGTLWGLLNAVTHDVDFNRGRRSADNRVTQAWFGSGERLKNRAFELAMEYAEA